MRARFVAAVLPWFLLFPVGGLAREAVPRGASAIEGQLIDRETSAGLAAERIVLWWRPPPTSREYPYPWEPAVGSGKLRRVASARADEQGMFRFEELGAGSYRLRIGLPHPGDALDVDVADGETVYRPIAVDLGRSVRGTVVRSDGTAVAGADVLVIGLEDGKGGNARFDVDPQGRQTRSDGTFLLATLPAGGVWVQAWHGAHGFSAPARIAPESGGGGIRLQLRDELASLHALDQPFAGVGISVSRSRVGPMVAAVDPERPAGEAGLREGDVIAAVDGNPTLWMTFDEFLMRCRGRAGEPVRLLLERDGQREDVTLIREAL